MQQALTQSLIYINNGYRDIVDIDRSKFFDEVTHHKILELIYEKVKCETTLRLIRKWLRSPILINGKLRKRGKGLPQDERNEPAEWISSGHSMKRTASGWVGKSICFYCERS